MNIQRSTFNLQRSTRRREAGAWLGVLLSLLGLVSGFAQANRNSATGFNATRYHPAPDFRQMEIKLTGSEAVQLPGSGKLYRVTKPHFTSFRKTGETEVIVETPECLFDETDPKARTLSSEQALSMRTGTGDFSITGRGFRWHQDQKTLIISNDVRALVRYTNNAPPLEITSRWFEFDVEQRRGIFHDNVRGEDTNQVFTCELLTISATTNKTQRSTPNLAGVRSGGLDYIEADGGLTVIGKQPGQRAKARRGAYHHIEQRLDLIGDAEWEHEGRSGQADRITAWQKGEDIEAHGKVRLTGPRQDLGAAGNLLGSATNTTAKTSATNYVTIFADHLTKRGDRFLAEGDVRITDGTNQLTCARIDGKKGTPESPEEFAAATGGVFVGRDNGGIHSDRADYSKAKEEILFTGNPRFVQDQIQGTAGHVVVDTVTQEIRAEKEVAVTFPLKAGSGTVLNFLPNEKTNQVAPPKRTDQKVSVTAQTFRFQDRRGLFTGNVVARELPADGNESRMRADEIEVLLAADQKRAESIQARKNVVCERGTVGVTNGPAEYTRMDCTTLTAYTDPATSELARLVADGGVDLRQPTRRAQGSKAVYTHTDKLLRLMGDCRIEVPEGVYLSKKELIWDNLNQIAQGSEFNFTQNPALLKKLQESEKLKELNLK
jgi:lipopolysaccharide export system protein LptA